MSSTLLQLVQNASAEIGLNTPSFVVGNLDTTSAQLLAILKAVGNELQREFAWQALDTEYRFTAQYLTTTGTVTTGSSTVTVANATGLDTTYQVTGVGINQDTWVTAVNGTTVTLSQPATVSGSNVALNFGKAKYAMPADYDRMIDRTHYDKSKRWEMLGPETAQQWQFLKSSYIATGPRMRYRILGGYFQIWPVVNTPEYLGFEYVSANWVRDLNGNPKATFTADTDTCIFPDAIMTLGLKKKFYEVKGFDFSSFAKDYRDQLSIAKAADAGSATLAMAPQPSSVLVGYENIPDSGYGY